MCFSHEHILYTAQHPVYLAGRYHFPRVPMRPREGRRFSEVAEPSLSASRALALLHRPHLSGT